MQGMFGLDDMRLQKRGRKGRRYKKYVVAFLDILGFSQLVNDPKNNELFIAAFDAVRRMNGMPNEKYPALQAVQYSVMSDSIVISVPYRNSGSFVRLLLCVYSLMLVLMANDVYLRGAVAIGPAYHEGATAFGPAIVQAYQLEDTRAIYPRCIVTPETLEEGLKTCSSDIIRQIDMKWLHLCEDGVYALDLFGKYLDSQCTMGTREELSRELAPLKSRIRRQLRKDYTDYVMQKYLWLKEDLNRAIREYCQKHDINPRTLLMN